MTASDQALLERWYVHRDAEAFKTIAQRHAGMVYATCRRVLRNASDAEEVAQECFEVLCSTHRRPNKNLASWLHTVATNRAINRIRSDKRRAEKISAYTLESRPNAEIEWNDLYDLVDEAIAELPPDLSEPIVRHFFEDESHDDIAQSLGLTRSAVTHRIHRAVDRLRNALQRRGVEIAAGALSVLLAKSTAAEAIPHTLTVSIAKLALAGPAVTTSAAGATIVAAKIVFACLLTAVAGFVVWKGLERKEPASDTPSVTAFATTQHESPDSSRDAAQTPSLPSGSSDIARAMTQALADAGADSSATTAITGRVYIVETGEPVSGMEIVLEPLGDRPEPQATVRTNGDGTYRMTVPVPGEYHIRRSYSHPGLPSPEIEPRTIRIAEGQVVEDLDFPIVMGIRVSGICVDEQGNPVSGAQIEGRDRDNYRSLESYITGEDGRFTLAGFPKTPRFTIDAEVRGKLVSDLYGPTPLKGGDVKDVRVVMRPVASIAGTVVDASGRPLPGIRVSANPMEQELQRYVGNATEETASDGAFRLEGLAPGNHRVFLQVPDASILRKPATGPEFIELASGESVTGLRLVYEDPDSVGLTIAGRVVDAKGAPIANAEVRSHGADAFRLTQSNDAGEFLIGGLPDITVTLVAEHAEHAKATTENVAAGTTGLQLVMDDLGTLEGQVVDAVTGEPVEQFELVHLDTTTRNHVGERTRMRPQIDPEGRFRIDNVAPGPVLLVAKADGYAETELEVEDLAPGQAVSNLRIALSGGTTLTVSVQTAAGDPVAGAYLIPGGVPNDMEPRLAAAAQTDAEGQFTLDNQPSTLDLLSVYHESYALATVPLSLNAGSANTVNVTLSAGCMLEGGVFVDGEPAEAVEVRLFMGNAPDVQRYATKTDTAGAYRFEHLPTGGAHALTLIPILLDDAPITRWFSQSVSLQEGKPTPLDFNLPPVTAAVEGFVTHDNAPAPASNMTLLVLTPFGTEQRNTNVDSTGAYRFDAVPAGHATIRADIHAQGLSATTEFELTDNQTAQVDLALVAVK
ncbi:MAG: hypothetical protein AMXMBFR82_19100 [Candidatus Hydrogenedentota bacterium]